MKITINAHCTPQEARAFLGLPDVQPMQDALMGEIRERMTASLQAVDAETLFKTWLPAQAQNIGRLQDVFWSQFARGAGDAKDT